MGFLLQEKRRQIAIIDIGSASVGLAIVNLDQKNPPEILYNYRSRANIRPDSAFKIFIQGILDCLEESLNSTTLENFKIDEVAVFLASPFYICQSNIINQKEEKPFTVIPKRVSAILNEKAEAFRQDNKVLYPELNNDQTIIIDNYLMQTKLNGYVVNSPYGYKVNSLYLSQYVSLGSLPVLNKFKEIIAKKLPRKKISFFTFSWSAFTFFKQWQKLKDYTILDVTGEMTDLNVITNGYLNEVASFPKGRNFLLKSLAEKLNTTPAEVNSSLYLFLEEKMDNAAEIKMQKALEELKEEWLQGLDLALKNIMESVLLPEQIYLVGDDAVTEVFSKWLSDERLRQYSLTNRPLSLKRITPDDTEEYVVNKAENKEDPFFPIEALFCQKVL